MNARPRTLGDFRRLGAAKLRAGGRSAREAKALHDKRRKDAEVRIEPVSVPEKPSATLELRKRMTRQSVVVPLGNAYKEFTDMAHAAHPRRQNWDSPKAIKDKPINGWRINEKNNGRYSSRCRYTHWTYEVQVHSVAFVMPTAIIFWFADLPGQRIAAPRGYHWGRDHNGVRLVCDAHPTRDYHPTASDLLELTPRQLAAKVQELAAIRRENERQRKAEAKRVAAEKMAAEERARHEAELILKAENEGLAVCLRDSLRAGNCEAGTRAFAARHGLDATRHYRPSELLAIANGDGRRVALVVAVALRRHREEMERGFCEVGRHQ